MDDGYGASPVKRRRRSRDQLDGLDAAIVAAVEAEHPVSLRGVYYRVVSAGAVEKTELGYRAVGRRLLALRRTGTIPYHWITDGTRWVVKPRTWSDVDQMLDDAAASYRRALWRDQPVEVHLFTEKDAITGVVESVTSRWDVPLGVLRGYASESFAYSMADAIRAAFSRDHRVFVYQLGDHDPSGVGAWRDFEGKVRGFLGDAGRPSHGLVSFERLAVTPEQIQGFGLPTRPTKRADPRAAAFAGESVEVDAIAPSLLRQLVGDAIEQHIDRRALRLTRIAEESERAGLLALRGQGRMAYPSTEDGGR